MDEADYDADGLVRVEVVEEDGPIERLTDVIATGETLRRELPDMPDGRQRATMMDFLLCLARSVEQDHPKGLPMLQAATPFEGSKAGVEYFTALLDADLVALYGIRRHIARLGEDQ